MGIFIEENYFILIICNLVKKVSGQNINFLYDSNQHKTRLGPKTVDQADIRRASTTSKVETCLSIVAIKSR